VLYIVSGRGTIVLDGKAVAVKPGLVVHIPRGIQHSIKAEGGRMTFVDFVQHTLDPAQAETKK
jgi:mannose-6-phosphate isomerase-like protein (cupin superfamily)